MYDLQYFLPYQSLLFHSPNSLCLVFIKASLSSPPPPPFMDCALGVVSKKSLPLIILKIDFSHQVRENVLSVSFKYIHITYATNSFVISDLLG